MWSPDSTRLLECRIFGISDRYALAAININTILRWCTQTQTMITNVQPCMPRSQLPLFVPLILLIDQIYQNHIISQSRWHPEVYLMVLRLKLSMSNCSHMFLYRKCSPRWIIFISLRYDSAFSIDTVIFPRIGSGIRFIRFSNFSKHVAINSIQIQTSSWNTIFN